ncbi:MAG TPA: SH3 domain-containing protein [Anaerolineaceae bacterium]|nr:SH3 domain-containing protein [Anaerolineaceae bacterium]
MQGDEPLKGYRGLEDSGQPPARPPAGAYCPNCGHPSPGLNLYCAQCGTYIPDPFAGVPAAFPPPVPAPVPARAKWLPWAVGAALLVVLVAGVIWLMGDAGGGENSRSGVSAGFSSPTDPWEAYTAQTPEPTRPSISAAPTWTPQKNTPTARVVIITATPEPSLTPTRAVTACPGAPEQRLEVGEDARVCTLVDSVFLRKGPGRRYEVLERVRPGTIVDVIGGPKCADDWSYWEVELPGGETGWMSEGGDAVDPYFLCPN